jgi:biopolymer transport protein ExbD
MRIGSPIPHKKGRIEIIPLIDIMFFLLASFMMVSLSQVHMKGIKVNLPVGQTGETQSKNEYISVSVDRNGNPYFDKDEMIDASGAADYNRLAAILKKTHDENPEAKVFVRGDADTVHGNIIRVLDILRSVGYYKVAFEIRSEAGKGLPGAGK